MRPKTTDLERAASGKLEDDIIDEKRTFFCSELIAKAYKVCNIMHPDEMKQASANFLPVDFTTGSKKLKLVPEATLTGEMNIQIVKKSTPKNADGKQMVFQDEDEKYDDGF